MSSTIIKHSTDKILFCVLNLQQRTQLCFFFWVWNILNSLGCAADWRLCWVQLTLAVMWENRSQGFWTGPTQTVLCNHRRWLVARNFGFRKKSDCTTYVGKTKASISCNSTACVFVFAYAKVRLSHDGAQLFYNYPWQEYEKKKSEEQKLRQMEDIESHRAAVARFMQRVNIVLEDCREDCTE